MSRNEFVWVEKYRPQTIDECILPDNIKSTFKAFLDKGEVPNLLLSGPPGCGKTTVAKALCNELGVDVYVINGSDEGRFLDTVRNNAKNFASTVQLALRAFTEEFVGNCRFIFTCNYKNKIVSPLHSRCAVIDFALRGKDRQVLAGQFFQRLQTILDQETIKYEPKVLAELINKYFPDWRRVLNECQRYSSGGQIDSGILASFATVKTDDLFKRLKEKDFSSVRKWVVNNLDNDPAVLLRSIYDACYNNLEGPGIAAAVLIIAKYQYQSSFVADQEINILACLTEIMVECEFK